MLVLPVWGDKKGADEGAQGVQAAVALHSHRRLHIMHLANGAR
jgi:hypothetical protein